MSFSGLCQGPLDTAGHRALEETVLSREPGATNDKGESGKKSLILKKRETVVS